VRNVSVMAVGPYFDAFAAVGPVPGASLGLHATINSEWRTPRWGPLTAAPSLVRPDGTFRVFPDDHAREGFRVEEVEAEVRAQLARMREAGLDPEYLDEHMVFHRLPGVEEALARIAREEGLVYAPDLSWWAGETKGGPYVAVYHPADEDAVSRGWILEGEPGTPGRVARERAEEARELLGPTPKGTRSMRYADLA
jgi:chitin disaccharide deacetylase